MPAKTREQPFTIETYRTMWGWTAAVYAGKQLRHLTRHCDDRESAERAAREWADGIETILRWSKNENGRCPR